MSTRIFTLTMAANVTQILPQGRFFMIKSALSALSIEARKRNGQPQFFENVGAGLQYNALETDKWYELHITSPGVQTVEIVISDDAQVTFSNAVSVTGTAATAELPSAALIDTGDTVQAIGTQTVIPANASRRRITIGNLSSSQNSIRVSTVGGATRGVEIQPGSYEEFRTLGGLVVRNDNSFGSGLSATWYAEEE